MLELERVPPDNRQSTREYVYHLLRDHIIRLKLKPGQPLSENEIAARLEMSRTPVREALIRLSQEGLLEVLPQRGTYVSLIDMDQVEEARFVRELLEPAVARQACLVRFSEAHLERLEENVRLFERCIEDKDYAKLFELDSQFHETLFAGCGKQRTWAIVHGLNAHLSRIRMLSMVSEFNWPTIVAQHREIAEAVKRRDAERAERVMRDHVSLIVQDAESLIRQYEGYFKKKDQAVTDR